MSIETRMKNVFLISRRSYCSISFVVSGQSKGLVGVHQIIQISWVGGGGGQGQIKCPLVQEIDLHAILSMLCNVFTWPISTNVHK